ncbi:unnamed protein product [Paramecium sonneborni]|uniref:Uncharacterized protein n=1 Tax=Paramecium sonneborni TaxID=65129 RepID=A0A8S1Q9I7_9CILI|nr:unnamed protein product [Paramecium sonneborni]
MQNQEDQRKTESEMPVDAVEHQLTPIIQKNLIPDQKGVVSPFAPADNVKVDLKSRKVISQCKDQSIPTIWINICRIQIERS